MKLEYIVRKEDENRKLGEVLKTRLKISSRLIIKLKKCKDAIRVNNLCFNVNTILKENDVIEILLDKTYNLEEYTKNKYEYEEFKYNLDIIYEDEYFICVNKPSMMATHPCANYRGDTLSDAVYTYFKEKYNTKFSMNLVNRLDRETSGLVIFARHQYIQEIFSRNMQQNLVHKHYIAVVDGIISEDTGIIEKNIVRKENSIIKRCIDDKGEYAKTEFSVISRNYDLNYTVVDIRIYTGRTHQIRVHMASIGHSLLGDYLYNTNEENKNYINRTALHAYSLEFNHPIDSKTIKLVADIPEDIKKLL